MHRLAIGNAIIKLRQFPRVFQPATNVAAAAAAKHLFNSPENPDDVKDDSPFAFPQLGGLLEMRNCLKRVNPCNFY